MVKILKNEEMDEQSIAALTKDEREWLYNGLDCACTLEILEKQLAEADDVALNTYEFSKSLMGPILEMNLRGTLIDLDQRRKVIGEFSEKRNLLAKNLGMIVREGIGYRPNDFNWRSHHQLKELFYKVLKIKPVKARNSNGIYAPTVNRDALEKLQRYFVAEPLCKHILLLREFDKKLQFIESELDPDGRLRTSFNIAGTNTGRLSSSESDFGTGTNEQNIERPLRRMFVPDVGYKFCNIDLEQADARHVGAICWELFVEKYGEDFAGSYLDACESGDLHTTVCKMAWTELDWPGPGSNRTDREIADETWYRDFSYRDGSKKLGHGTNYYGTPRTMAMHTKVETRIIESFQRRYFDGFPVIGSYDKRLDRDNWHTWTYHQINQFGYLITPFYGRRRYFFGRPDDPRTLREAIAYCPQSMTADAIDTALLRIWQTHRVQILIQVHDSILFQYPVEEEDDIIPEMLRLASITHTLKRGRRFVVPAEAKIGWNWADESKENPDGLVKWEGPGVDKRPRPQIRSGQPYGLTAMLEEK